MYALISFVVAIGPCSAAPSGEPYFDKAKEALLKRDTKGAYAAITKAIEQNPKHFESRAFLLGLYLEDKAYNHAEKLLDIMQRQFPDNHNAHQLAGDYQFTQGNMARARSAYETCLALKTHHYLCYVGLASVHFRERNADAGIALLLPAIPHLHDKPYFYNFIASFYGQKGDFPGALAYINKALIEDAGYLPTYINAADFLVKMGKFQESLLFLETIDRNDPGNIQSLLNKGIAYLGLKRPELAIAAFDAVLAKEPNNPLALYNKALCLVESGRKPAAKLLLERAMPYAAAMPDVQEKIRNLSASIPK